jgi:hypothetical protein
MPGDSSSRDRLGNSLQRSPLPSETRDFAPTPLGWVGIIVATGMLASLIWRMGEDGPRVSWLAVSVVIGYFIATMAWAAIRTQLDKREDRKQN